MLPQSKDAKELDGRIEVDPDDPRSLRDAGFAWASCSGKETKTASQLEVSRTTECFSRRIVLLSVWLDIPALRAFRFVELTFSE